MIPTSVSQRCFLKNKGCLKRHCFCLLKLLQHMSKHEMQFMCVQQPSVLRSDLYSWCKKGEDYFHTNKQNWLEQQLHRFPQVFCWDKQTQRIPKLSNVWILRKTVHMKLSNLTVSLKVTTNLTSKTLQYCVWAKNERLCTFVYILFQTFSALQCVGFFVGKNSQIIVVQVDDDSFLRVENLIRFCKLRHLGFIYAGQFVTWVKCHLFHKKKKKTE